MIICVDGLNRGGAGGVMREQVARVSGGNLQEQHGSPFYRTQAPLIDLVQ